MHTCTLQFFVLLLKYLFLANIEANLTFQFANSITVVKKYKIKQFGSENVLCSVLIHGTGSKQLKECDQYSSVLQGNTGLLLRIYKHYVQLLQDMDANQ